MSCSAISRAEMDKLVLNRSDCSWVHGLNKSSIEEFKCSAIFSIVCVLGVTLLFKMFESETVLMPVFSARALPVIPWAFISLLMFVLRASGILAAPSYYREYRILAKKAIQTIIRIKNSLIKPKIK